MSARPRIGITTSYADGAQALDGRYTRAVEAAGGLPIIAPMFEREETARTFAAILDGLIIPGGPGITRGLIGGLPPDLPAVNEARDRSDALIFQAMANRPFLGICYGMQFANAMAGGSIFGDVQAQAGADIHSADRGANVHDLQIVPGSRLHAIFGEERLLTNSHHIQALMDLGAGLRVSARAADGVIEAIESADGRVIGVQFHPERMLDLALPLFQDLVARARR